MTPSNRSLFGGERENSSDGADGGDDDDPENWLGHTHKERMEDGGRERGRKMRANRRTQSPSSTGKKREDQPRDTDAAAAAAAAAVGVLVVQEEEREVFAKRDERMEIAVHDDERHLIC